MAYRDLASLLAERQWYIERYGESMAGHIMGMDASLMRSDDRQALLVKMERHATAVFRADPKYWQRQLRAIAIWRLRQQLVEPPVLQPDYVPPDDDDDD